MYSHKCFTDIIFYLTMSISVQWCLTHCGPCVFKFFGIQQIFLPQLHIVKTAFGKTTLGEGLLDVEDC
jgi:hypothetical protein